MSQTMSGTAAGGSLLDKVKLLVGSGDRIGRFVAPVLLVGLALNLWRPDAFAVGGPAGWLSVLSWTLLVPGIVIWAWSVELILARVPRHELITTGPFALVKHPLYSAVALLVLPAVGFLLNSWLGLVLGLTLYVAARRYAPQEEETLSREFGAEWDAYTAKVLAPWI